MVSGLLSRGGIQRVHRAHEARHPLSSGNASVSSAPRLLIVARGCRSVAFVRSGKPGQFELIERDALYIGGGCWIVTSPGVFLSLGIIFDMANPRLVLTREGALCGPAAQRWVLPLEGIATASTNELLSDLSAESDGKYRDHASRRIAELLLMRAVECLSFVPQTGGRKSQRTFRAALHFVESNFSRRIDRSILARELQTHPSHVTRLFLRFAGESFGSFLLRTRLERARELLRDRCLSVSEVAYHCGFAQPSHFSRSFKQRYGVTPGQFRLGEIENHTVETIEEKKAS